MRKSETLVQYTKEGLIDSVKHSLRRGKGKLFLYAINRFQWKYYPKWRKVTEFPLNVDIEVSSRCNLQCDHCFRQYMDIKENDLMPMDMYKKIIDECVRYKLFTLKFSMRGEPTLHPELPEMVRYAKDKGVKEVWINTHGGNLTEKLCEELIKNRTNWITVSFDGLGKMYESIRKPLKYEESLEKLKILRKVRDRLKANTIINAQTLWSPIKDNPEEYILVIGKIVDRISYNMDMNFKEIMLVSDDNFICPRLWQRLAITSHGDFLKCPSDFQKEEVLGNIKNNTIKEIWDNAQQKQRELHLAGKKKESVVCQKCHHGAKKVKKQINLEGDKESVFSYKFKQEFEGVGLNRN